jgi:hypothetical protein
MQQALLARIAALTGMACSSLTLSLCFSKPAIARPAPVFEPYLPEIIDNLPTGALVRLPPQIHLGGPAHLNPQELVVNVLAVFLSCLFR